MDNPWVILLFLSIFHVIGASVLASALRDLWRALHQEDPMGCRSAFLVVWATMFGCFPFGLGAGFAATESGMPLLLLAEVLVWLSTFLAVLLAQQVVKQLLEPFLHPEALLMLFGGGLLVAGVSVVSWFIAEERLVGLLAGGIFTLVGGGIFAYGLWRLLRSTS